MAKGTITEGGWVGLEVTRPDGSCHPKPDPLFRDLPDNRTAPGIDVRGGVSYWDLWDLLGPPEA